MRTSRDRLEAFRVTARERRELRLLAKVRGVTKSELLRTLVREAAEKEAGEEDCRTRMPGRGENDER